MDSFSSTSITRRAFLGGSVAVGGMLLVSCSDSAPTGKNASAASTLRVGIPTDVLPGSIQRFQAQNQAIRRTVFDYVLDKNPDGSYRPALASKWTWSADHKSLVLTLRDDVTFHSGRAFGPQDVIDSVKAATAKGSGVQASKLLAKATGMTATGPNELTVTFDKPFLGYLDGLAMLPIVDSRTMADLESGKQVVGTGPFVWKSWSTGSKLELVRNDKYWGTKPQVRTLDFSVISDAQALLAAMRAGSLDMAMRMLPRDAATLKKDGRYSVSTTAGYETYVGVNTKVKPFDDVRVRQAVAYSLDRQRISDQVYNGFATPSAIPWSSGTPGVTPEQVNRYALDVDKAKDLLRQAGAAGAQVTLTAQSSISTYKAIQDIVQYGLEQIGLKVRAISSDPAQFPKHMQGGDFTGLWITDVALTSMGEPTALLTANPITAAKNTSNFVTDDYRKLVGKVISAASDEEQKASGAALTDYMLDQAFHNSVVQTQTPIVTVKALTGISSDLTLAVDFTKAALTA